MNKLLIATAMIACATAANAQWTLNNEKDIVTLKSDPYISTHATYSDSKYRNTPFMGINCNSIYFGNLDILNSGMFRFRTNNQLESTTMYGNEWQGNDGISLVFAKNKEQEKHFWKQAEGHFQNMVRDNELFVKFSSYSRSSQNAIFELGGFTKKLKELKNLCLK